MFGISFKSATINFINIVTDESIKRINNNRVSTVSLWNLYWYFLLLGLTKFGRHRLSLGEFEETMLWLF